MLKINTEQTVNIVKPFFLQGPEGPPGPQGPAAIVNYSRINQTIKSELLEIKRKFYLFFNNAKNIILQSPVVYFNKKQNFYKSAKP